MSQDEIGDFYHHWVNYRKTAVSVLMRNDHGKPSRGSLGDDIAREEVGTLLDCDRKPIAWLVNPEEDHCHILR